MFICCDTCRDTLVVVSYDGDPPRHGWTKQKPRFAPGLDEWRCPECRAFVEKRRALAAEEEDVGEMGVSDVELLVQSRELVRSAVKTGKMRRSREWLESLYGGQRRKPGRVPNTPPREMPAPTRRTRLARVA